MTQFIPSEVTDRIKQGFSAPDATWFRGESIDYVRRVLLDGDAALYDVLDRRAVTDLVEDHLEGRANRRLLIWSFLCLELWARTFL
jgi:asparagine synthase (glutamine-hydrolysing)